MTQKNYILWLMLLWGYGGKDIFFSKNINGTGMNLLIWVRKVNSSGNEMFPFISKEGEILFFQVMAGLV